MEFLHSYLAIRDNIKVTLMKLQREEQRRLWDEVGYPRAVRALEAKMSRKFWDGTVNG
jgi:hypothetical protein